MEWFSQDWVWVLFFVGFVAMHMFGHRGHGRHGGGRGGRGGHNGPETENKDSVQRTPERGAGHQH